MPLLPVLLPAGGCSRVPKIIVLEDPVTAAEHLDPGVACEQNGELDLARREYEMALGKDKKSLRARINLGNVSLAKKDYGKARGEYLLALELRPINAEATNNIPRAARQLCWTRWAFSGCAQAGPRRRKGPPPSRKSLAARSMPLCRRVRRAVLPAPGN